MKKIGKENFRLLTEKKKFKFLEKKHASETNTKIRPWFQILIPKPDFGCMLIKRIGKERD